jgi:hypothetical protein
MPKPTLANLVDDYLAKHQTTVDVGHKRDRALKSGLCECTKEAKTLLEACVKANAERARAFHALREARPKFRRKPDMWDKLAKR